MKELVAKHMLGVTVTLLILFTSALYYHSRCELIQIFNLSTIIDIPRNSMQSGSRSESNKKKLILFFTPFFQRNIWEYVYVFDNYTKRCGCDFTRCEYTYDRMKFGEADAVIFHGRNMPSFDVLDDLNKIRRQERKNQRWVYFLIENPLTSPSVEPHDKYFNWTITYRLNADIRKPYNRHRKLKQAKPVDDFNYAANKTKQVAWFVGRCGMNREKLKNKLEEHGVRVDIAGRCKTYKNHSHWLECSTRACTNELKSYKFYFAAENNLCTDYITEKYWRNGMNVNLVPIVFGGADYSNPRLAIPGSFIDALKFKTPKGLADYIKELDKDDKRYNEYFKWKSRWEIVKENEGCDKFMCDLCDKLHGNNHPPDRPLSSQIRKEECTVPAEKFKKWIET